MSLHHSNKIKFNFHYIRGITPKRVTQLRRNVAAVVSRLMRFVGFEPQTYRTDNIVSTTELNWLVTYCIIADFYCFSLQGFVGICMRFQQVTNFVILFQIEIFE